MDCGAEAKHGRPSYRACAVSCGPQVVLRHPLPTRTVPIKVVYTNTSSGEGATPASCPLFSPLYVGTTPFPFSRFAGHRPASPGTSAAACALVRGDGGHRTHIAWGDPRAMRDPAGFVDSHVVMGYIRRAVWEVGQAPCTAHARRHHGPHALESRAHRDGG